MARRSWLVLGGMALGVGMGWWASQRHLASHRADLFSPRPWRRLAALGYLAGEHGVAPVRVLHDYLAWERHPLLRRRAEALLRRLELSLG